MARFKHLADVYRFPGFIPFATVKGVFGDPQAVVVTLRRRQKKRFVASVGRRTSATTTNGPDRSAIFPVVTRESTWPTEEDVSSACGVRA